MKQNNLTHIHAKYQNYSAVIAIETGELIEGQIPLSKQRLLAAWVEIHREDLLADWELAVNGQQVFTIEPLR